MSLMGEEGRSYELARKLEACGVWRSWLGDFKYAGFSDFLNSPSSWKAFMRIDESNSRAHIHLQLRVRALLFDKASISLFLRSNPLSSSSLASSSIAVSKLNPSCESSIRFSACFFGCGFGDDVYFTLENSAQDWVQQWEGGVLSNTASSKENDEKENSDKEDRQHHSTVGLNQNIKK
ncbi:uncharacterized protein LOC122275935 isoform X3 [Carya illinoinensis]|uniref:uncharacterized protein LOC122275935 isoform X3 n=1 Tax=Carya illinoinensis TaxID=32201 RepID=UPI001C71D118|nr:uncharacterized protein LOC122275935 isoform X3 [Carya illinoinensis]